MVYGPFSLAGANAAIVRFKFWLYTQGDHDYLDWLASTDGQNFGGYQASGNSEGWLSYDLDLADMGQMGSLLGRPQVWIAFVFESDGSTALAEGAYLDDIQLMSCSGGPCTTAGSALAPEGQGQVRLEAASLTRSR
jgi:hypothetical protein